MFAGPGKGVVAFQVMLTPLACFYHWYTSALFFAPVLGVGAWGWWSSRRIGRNRRPPASPTASHLP